MIKPNALNDVTMEFIIEYCKENHQVAWLKDEMVKEVKPDKNGKERKISFIEIRKDFTTIFFPEIAPKKKPKKPTMYQLVAMLEDE